MQYYNKHITEELLDMALKLSYMCLTNIEWSVLYSGAGILNILSNKDIKELLGKEYDDKAKIIFHNLIPIQCMYKKAKPVFLKALQEKTDSNSYMWDLNSFTREITPSSQAFCMLSLCRASEILKVSDPALSAIMIKNAEAFYNFTINYLKNEYGFFTASENKTKLINDELNIKLNKKDIKLLDQVFIHEALLYLHHLTFSYTTGDCFSENSINYLNEARTLFKYLFANYNALIEEPTRDISLSISSLARCCSIEKEPELKTNFQHLIALLCAEIESRIKVNGEVEKNFDDLPSSSLITHFRVISAFLDGYIETGIEKFKELAFRIYRFVENLYDYTTELFVRGEIKKIKYSIRDIGEIVKCLYTIYLIDNDSKTLDTLLRFYKTSIEKSGIFQSSAQRNIRFMGYDITIPENIPLAQEVYKAPVFLKGFKLNLKKNMLTAASKYFSSYYALYASYIILFHIEPLIDNKNKLNQNITNSDAKIETITPSS